MPFVLIGTINRVKSLWSGRKGPPILQLGVRPSGSCASAGLQHDHDAALPDRAVIVLLVTAVGGAALDAAPRRHAARLLPLRLRLVRLRLGARPLRLMLAALDTGSSFEGMGAAREATFSTLLEPALFLVAGALSLLTHARTLHGALAPHLGGRDPASSSGAWRVVTLLDRPAGRDGADARRRSRRRTSS